MFIVQATDLTMMRHFFTTMLLLLAYKIYIK
jgi:hypothetical protein